MKLGGKVRGSGHQRRDARGQRLDFVQIQSAGLYNDKLEAGFVIFNSLRQQG